MAITRNLVGKYVDTYAFPDGRFEVRWKSLPLTYSVFDKDQRVSHAAVTENKRLGAVFAHIQDLPIQEDRTAQSREGWSSRPAHRQAAKEAEAVRATGQAFDP